MFQSTVLKRAAKLAAPAAAAAAGVVSMTSSSSGGDERLKQQQQVRGVAMCEDKSVLSMLGDIQARVSFL